jgi:hypothetical protein
LALCSLFVCFSQRAATAASISFAGDLRTDANFIGCGSGCTLGAGDDDATWAQFAAVSETFAVSDPSRVEAITFSYGGGTNGAGATILEGGFSPYLSLFDGAGNFLASTYTGPYCPPGAQTDTLTGQCNDVLLDAGNLAPGDYQIAISAYLNMSLAENTGAGTLADGFTGLGNLDGDLHYAFDVIVSGAATPTPEPGTWLLLPAALAAFTALLRRQLRRSE